MNIWLNFYFDSHFMNIMCNISEKITLFEILNYIAVSIESNAFS